MSVRAKPQQARSLRGELAPGRKQRRAVLPSGRVCAFVVPVVREHMKMLEEAVANVMRRSLEGQDPVPMEFSNELAARAIRTLLVGVTAEPVPEIYRDGVTPERARVEAEVALRAKLAEQLITGAEVVEAAIVDRLPAIVEDLLTAARDAEKMCAVANLVPVTDLEWTEGETVGARLRRMPDAEIGTAEAEDWVALHHIALVVAQPVKGADPKAGTRTKPLMLSSTR
jgi:hypothetical protein